MHLLITNDDGIHHPALLALVQEIKKIGKVSVVAPDKNWSACGHVKTMTRAIRVDPTTLADGTPAFACDGAPSDCVALALLGLVTEKVDMVISGINPHANLGYDVTYSGTVTAAFEAAIHGLPAVAVSLETPYRVKGEFDFSVAAKAVRVVVERVLKEGLPKDTILSVNVPYIPYEELKGFQVTEQGERLYHDELIHYNDPYERPFYWIGGDPPTGVERSGTDIGSIREGFVSITPLRLNLTDYSFLDELKNWNW
ncbi:MAG: 5'/3'-nucleotidase SurE [Anaerolineales bacterium]|nr:5'/3'-nucleotidase SurE [Anaerolineales bacterium]